MGKNWSWTKPSPVNYWAVDRWINRDLYDHYCAKTPTAAGCIEWIGPKSRINYGLVGFKYAEGKTSPSGHRSGMMSAHRLAFMLAHDRLPGKSNINHTCHNKLCVNPDHLVEGTQADKLQAMVRDGIRATRAGGEYEYNHKQAGRSYKYTDDEIQWYRCATIAEIQARDNLDARRASMRRAFFRTGYRWLPMPEYTRQKPGRKSE